VFSADIDVASLQILPADIELQCRDV